MKKGLSSFILLSVVGTLVLLQNFYNNKWHAVEPEYYQEWQIQYDRMVIARLARTHQEGFFSDGGLLGLGDATKWNYWSSTHTHQYNVYFDQGEFQTYLVYRSNPGFQGVLYGIIDRLLTIRGEKKIEVFRRITATITALIFGVIFALIAMEFGFLAGIFTFLFSAFSIWIVLPAGSIFWNFWVFYLPFLAGIYFFVDSIKRGKYIAGKVYILLFLAILAKILLSGFDIITTVLVMSTVPIVYFGIRERWGWKLFMERFIKISIVLSVATATGLAIMSFQIAIADGNTANIFSYIESRFGHHFAGNSDYYLSGNIEATKIGIFEVTGKYLAMPAINLRLPGPDKQILYWHTIVLFAAFTGLYFLFHKKREGYPRKAIALIVSTWFSILAPLSWYILFRPHSIIHTHVNTMGWQMPFTLLGSALCGYVVTGLFKKNVPD